MRRGRTAPVGLEMCDVQEQQTHPSRVGSSGRSGQPGTRAAARNLATSRSNKNSGVQPELSGVQPRASAPQQHARKQGGFKGGIAGGHTTGQAGNRAGRTGG
jgi:hypothetical protein